MRVLGIETSCDECGIAVYDSQHGLIAHGLHSQVAMHAEYGGVVPELASRDHILRIIPLIRQTLAEADTRPQDLSGIAYTSGPGLIGALLVGSTVARSLALTWDLPAIGIHHLEGHLLAPMLEAQQPSFPFLALLVSGGHTLLIRVDGIGRYTELGASLDDAVGEAFDKTAKLLGLGYPGGPALEILAETGNPKRFRFPRPMTDRPGLAFSFSGLKTFAMNTLKNSEGDDTSKADIARAFQDAVIDTMRIKCRRALRETGLKDLIIAGGVSANTRLREALSALAKTEGGQAYFPRQEFCTDNGAMIAYAGWHRLKAGHSSPLAINVRPRWPLNELEAC